MRKNPEVGAAQDELRKSGWQKKRVNVWFGFNFSAWIKALCKSEFQIDKNKIPLAISITFSSLNNALLRGMEHLIYAPKVARVEIEKPPLFIIGHWRCGTTLLHELLALDERHTYPATYQCFNPNHFLLTQRLYASRWNSLLPSKRPMDNMAIASNTPQEDEFALCLLGALSPYLAIAFPNRLTDYMDYFSLERFTPEELKRCEGSFVYFLKRITFARPGRIILKSPVHTFRIKVLLKLFPQARFVHIVRDPYVVFPSTLHMWRRMFQAFSLQSSCSVELEDYVFKMFNHLYESFEETRKLIPSLQIYQVRYEDLVKDTMGEMQKLYSSLGLGSFEPVLPAVKDYLAKAASYKKNIYELPQNMRAEISRRWGKIIKRYGYPLTNEVP
ncbi:sulfotransferase [Candidatus Aerophobetes bacterium]|nr:sulfotransferase [Candidatus Aerophobetes bacterium]